MADWLTDAKAHALAEYPRECCGVLIVFKGREQYRPCRNTATSPGDHFVMSAEDYAEAEDAGGVTAVVHSHPDTAARPSEADRVACEASGLPWYIVSVLRDGGAPTAVEVHRFEPCGYEAPLVGRTFHHGVLDCYTLIQDWYARERGITLPHFERRDGWWDDGHSDLYTEHFREAGFEPVSGEPQPGDVLLMQIQSGNRVPNHAGIYLGDGVMLHHMAGRLSSRDVWGGWYRDCTRLIVRYAGAKLASTSD